MPTTNPETPVNAAHVNPAVAAKFWGGAVLRRERTEEKRLPLPGWLMKGGPLTEFRERVEMRSEIAEQEAQERLGVRIADSDATGGNQLETFPEEQS